MTTNDDRDDEQTQQNSSDADPLSEIRDHREAFKRLAKREDRIGAVARGCLARLAGQQPAPGDKWAFGLDHEENGDER